MKLIQTILTSAHLVEVWEADGQQFRICAPLLNMAIDPNDWNVGEMR